MIFQLNLAAFACQNTKLVVLRDRGAMRNSKEYYELRNYALNFLEQNFTPED
jgi:hypothetical protein